jgi:hypothetical protein
MTFDRPLHNYDEPVTLLGRRFPLLLSDISQWVRANPASTKVKETVADGRVIRQGHTALVYNCLDAREVLGQLDSEARCVHLYPDVADFLHFLTRPAARECLAHDKWQPLLLLPLQHANHIRHWLATITPSDWPWAFCDKQHFTEDPADLPARSVGVQMYQLLKALTGQLSDKLRAKYVGRATPRGVLLSEMRALRVLALAFAGSSYQQFCARDVAQAFTAGGNDGRALILTAGPARHYELLKAIDDFDPDVLFLNGRARCDFENLPQELSVVSWDQDYALSTRTDLASSMGARDRLLVMIEEWIAEARHSEIPREKMADVNLGTNERLYQPPVVRDEPEYDVLFVGNYHPWELYRSRIQFDSAPPQMQKILSLAREKLADWTRTRDQDEPFILPDLDQLIRNCCTELKLAYAGSEADWRFLVCNFRYRIAHLLLRELYVSQLSEFKLGLFGRGWDAIPQLAGIGQPEIENGRPLIDAIHRSAINLHLHTWTVHHPRLYDTAAAGGFLLVGRVPEMNPLETVFDVGQELDSFGSIAELKQKIRHYLAHRDQRESMARRAADRARREHSMRRRMAQVGDFLARDGHEPCH